jgi:hypothetical protein
LGRRRPKTTGAGLWTIDLSNATGDIGTYMQVSFTGTSFAQTDFTALLGTGHAGSFVLGANDLSFVVSAIPEPAIYAVVFGAAILGFAVCRRRRAS